MKRKYFLLLSLPLLLASCSNNISSSSPSSSASSALDSSSSRNNISSSTSESEVKAEDIEDTDSQYFEFKLLDNDTYKIESLATNDPPKRVGIPATYLNKSITAIADGAFRSAGGVEIIRLSDSISALNSKAFIDCTTIKEVLVYKTNTHYQSLNGVLYSFNKSTLVYFPSAKEGEYSPIDECTVIASFAFQSSRKLTAFSSNKVVTIEGNALNASKFTSRIASASLKTIGESAFDTCTNLLTISLNEGLEEIGASAFTFCTSLKELVLPASLKKLEPLAFFNCKKNTKIEFKGDLITSIPHDCFGYNGTGNTELKVTLPSKLESIGDDAFTGDQAMKNLTLPETLESIGSSAFYACNDLASLVIPKNVSTIGDMAFYGTISLASLTVDSSNQYFEINNNSLTDIGNTKILFVIYKRGDYQVKEGVETLSRRCFGESIYVTGITLPVSIKHLYLPFYGCTSLTRLSYSGTVSQFETITNNSVFTDSSNETHNWNEGLSTIAYVQCSDGNFTIE